MARLCYCFTRWKQFRVFKSKRDAIAQLVDGTDKQTLATEWLAVTDRAGQSQVGGIRDLWPEFDERLVYSSDMSQLYITPDVEHFFDARTLVVMKERSGTVWQTAKANKQLLTHRVFFADASSEELEDERRLLRIYQRSYQLTPNRHRCLR